MTDRVPTDRPRRKAWFHASRTAGGRHPPRTRGMTEGGGLLEMRAILLISLSFLLNVVSGCTASSGSGSHVANPDAIAPENCPSNCADIPAGGLCIGDWAVKCGDDQGVCTDCSLTNQKCVHSEALASTSCEDPNVDNPTCLPECEDKTCGEDGCGGSCGFCPSSGICDGTQCHLPGEPCGDIPSSGACLGNAVATCVDGGLQYLDCTPLSRICGYSTVNNKTECLLPQ